METSMNTQNFNPVKKVVQIDWVTRTNHSTKGILSWYSSTLENFVLDALQANVSIKASRKSVDPSKQLETKNGKILIFRQKVHEQKLSTR